MTKKARHNPMLFCLVGLMLCAPLYGSDDSDGKNPASIAGELSKQLVQQFPDPWLMRESDGAYRWSYTIGLVLLGMERLAGQDGDEQTERYIQRFADHYIQPDGSIGTLDLTEFNIDSINSGKILFSLYERTGDERYRLAMQQLRRQLQWQPRTHSGGFWHKLKYPWQIWLDGIYMAQPFLAQYEASFGDDPQVFDDIVSQFVTIEAKTRDPATGLLFHGWDESRLQAWSNPESGLSPGFWSRAIGWYAMAIVDTLDYLPAGHPGHTALPAILQRLVDAMLPWQHESGLWYQVPDQGSLEGNWLETSGTSMMVYAVAKGVRQGVLDESYLGSARKGYAGLLRDVVSVHADGRVEVRDICRSAGLGGDPYRDGSYQYYVSTDRVSDDAHGVGSFLLAASEMALLEQSR